MSAITYEHLDKKTKVFIGGVYAGQILKHEDGWNYCPHQGIPTDPKPTVEEVKKDIEND